jgi:hypothetical protein
MKVTNSKWEEVAEGTSRLGVDGGWLYRVGGALAYVPTAITATLDDISEHLAHLANLIEEVTCMLDRSYGGDARRAVRICSID